MNLWDVIEKDVAEFEKATISSESDSDILSSSEKSELEKTVENLTKQVESLTAKLNESMEESSNEDNTDNTDNTDTE